MLLGFKQRFAPFVEEGSKTHTIRANRKIRPKVGETCHCYTGLRQKGARLLGRWECVRVEDVLIYECDDGVLSVVVEGETLSADEKNALAWRDGFRGSGKRYAWREFTQFWHSTHGTKGKRLAFAGHIIHWKYSKRNRSAPIRKPRAA